MIQIIKHGKLRVSECPQCGCVFSFEEEDVETEEHELPKAAQMLIMDRQAKIEIRTITCPECGIKYRL